MVVVFIEAPVVENLCHLEPKSFFFLETQTPGIYWGAVKGG